MRILTLLLVLANVVVLALWSGAIPGTSERDPARFDRQISAERLQVRQALVPDAATAPAAPQNAEPTADAAAVLPPASAPGPATATASPATTPAPAVAGSKP